VRDVNITSTEFPAAYTGEGVDEPYSWNGCMLSSEATFVMVTRFPLDELPKSKCWKLTLMMYPLGTVIFQVCLLFCGKLFGKLGLEKIPLDPIRKS